MGIVEGDSEILDFRVSNDFRPGVGVCEGIYFELLLKILK